MRRKSPGVKKKTRSKSWETRQFVSAIDLSALSAPRPVLVVLQEYCALAERLLFERDIEPKYYVEMGDSPTFEIAIMAENEDAQRLLAASDRPHPQHIALFLHAYSTMVAHAIDKGLAEAAVVNAMRLERLYLQLEYALKIEPHAQSGYKRSSLHKLNLAEANSSRERSADDAVLAAFTKWQSATALVLVDANQEPLSAAARVKRYLTTQKPKDRVARRIRSLLDLDRIPPLK